VNPRNRRLEEEEGHGGAVYSKSKRDLQNLDSSYYNKDGSLDRRRVNPRNKRHGGGGREEQEDEFE